MIEVLPIGTTLKVGVDHCRIIRIMVGVGNSVEYEVAYWVGGERKTQWVPSEELQSLRYVEERTKIGFKT